MSNPIALNEDVWNSTLAELLVIKIIVASLLEQTAKQTADPAAFLARIHSDVIATIQGGRFKGGDAHRNMTISEKMQQTADELLSAMTARVLRDK
jgi:hypothetical protein